MYFHMQRTVCLLFCVALLGIFALNATAAAGSVLYTSHYSGATVFLDKNRNGSADEGEPQSVTAADGTFVPPRGSGARMYLSGGHHVLTGKPNSLLLAIPPGAKAAGVLTTLWQALADRGQSVGKIRKRMNLGGTSRLADFRAKVDEASGISRKVDELLRRDGQQETVALFLSALASAQAGSVPPAAAQSPAGFPEHGAIGALADALVDPVSASSSDLASALEVNALLTVATAKLQLALTADQQQLLTQAIAESLNRPTEVLGAKSDVFGILTKLKYDGAAYLKNGDFEGFQAYFSQPFGLEGMAVETGTDGADHITRDSTPTIFGSAGPDAVAVRIFRDGQALSPDVRIEFGGRWYYTSPRLPDGEHSFTAAAVLAEQTQAALSAPLKVNVDTQAPLTPTVQPPLRFATSMPTIKGGWDSRDNHALRVSLNGMRYSPGDGLALDGTGWSLAVPPTKPLPTGTLPVVAECEDLAGNRSTVKTAIRIFNAQPLADIQVQPGMIVGTPVELDGSGSSDANGDVLSYRWTLLTRPKNSTSALTGAQTAKPQLTADVPGAYVIRLIVSDGSRRSTPVVKTLNASQDSRPVASAGSPQTGRTGIAIHLTGSASDPEGDQLTYRWTLTGPAGSAASLIDANTLSPSFTPDLAGQYLAELVASDGALDSLPASVAMTVAPENAPEVAAINPPAGRAGVAVQVSATASDLDGDTLTYRWTLTPPAGSAATLSAGTTLTPNFEPDVPGQYGLSLVANDGWMDSAPVTITATVTPETKPVASAGNAATGRTGISVQLKGSASDADGDPLSYRWTLTAPAGSHAVLTGGDTLTPGFTPDVAGDFTAVLVANDGWLDSFPSTVVVTVKPETKPVASAGGSQAVTTEATVSLEGSAVDAEGDPLTYRWTLTPPAGSHAALIGGDTLAPKFTADIHGQYTATLIANDGRFDSAPATATIDVAFSGKVTVGITATDPNGLPLHYRWKVSEGNIEDIDSPATTWTLPPGPGVHFANVLVHNDQGGYAARRIAVISDALGTQPPQLVPQDFDPPSNGGETIAADTAFVAIGSTDFASHFNLARAIYLPGIPSPIPSLDPESDGYGRQVYTQNDDLDAYFDHVGVLTDAWSEGKPHTNGVSGDYLVGAVKLADGHLCGTHDPFFHVASSAYATAVDVGMQVLGPAVEVNRYGDYALPWNAQTAFVRVECEAAPPVYAAVNPVYRVAETAVFSGSGQPLISSDPATMTARVEGRSAGIFLPTQLGLPSDDYPNGDLFLAFKGIDSQQAGCEYYRTIGAVQSCDSQGNPAGAITFDDWKRKTGMDPYVRPGGEEVDATYINRIDLNLTRRHHAIAYADGTPPVLAELGHNHTDLYCGIRTDGTIACWGGSSILIGGIPPGQFTQVGIGEAHVCALRADQAIVCWGDNYYGQSAAPSGKFVHIGVGDRFSCGVKTDGTATCWGDNGYGQATPPAGSFVKVGTGHSHGCGIKTDGSLTCWGWNRYGQATPPPGSFVEIQAGGDTSCGLKSDQTVACWGYLAGRYPSPSGRFSQLSVSGRQACAVNAEGGGVACWGEGSDGNNAAPAGAFSQAMAGVGYDCGLAQDGSLSCWGEGAPDFKNRVAAYVCNHLGPPLTATQQEIDQAIDNAVNGRNLVACVAMDYGRHDGREVLPFVRYYIFSPSEQLLMSINLDGRQEKYVPGTCVACHGGDKYDGHFPTDGSGSPDYGGHFLPYDVGNFAFSSHSGLTQVDQQAAIHRLNQIVLKTAPSPIAKTLVDGWYAAGTDVLDENYWPPDWQEAAAQNPEVDVEHLYKDVHARYCRTCHVALERLGSGTSTHNPEEWRNWPHTDDKSDWERYSSVICGGSPWLQRNHTMPNSLVTFNRLWNDAAAVRLLKQQFGDSCGDSKQRSPQLGDPVAVMEDIGLAVTTGTAVTLDGRASNSVTGVLTYRWTLLTPPGSQATLQDATAAMPTFVPDMPGTYVALLTVNDGLRDSVAARLSFEAYSANAVIAQFNEQGPIRQAVSLDGRASTSAGGGALTYSWSLKGPAGSTAVLNDVNAAQPSVEPDVPGLYEISLVVNDGQRNSVPAWASFTATNVSVDVGVYPLAWVGAAVPVDASRSVSVNGRSLTYFWEVLSRPTGSKAELTQGNTAKPGFIPDQSGWYGLQVWVGDGDPDADASAQVWFFAKVPNGPPDRQVAYKETLVLDMALSVYFYAYSGNNPVTFEWTLTTPPGSAAQLSDTAAAQSTLTPDVPGRYTVQMIIRYGAASTVAATYVISAYSALANACCSGPVQIGGPYYLSSQWSASVTGNPITYHWTLAAPPGSIAQLSDASVAGPVFTPDVVGTYTAQLVINDGVSDSEPATVQIQAYTATATMTPCCWGLTYPVDQPVTMDGSPSTTSTGSPLSYRWTLTPPVGSSSAFNDATAVKPTFIPDKVGSYTVQLIVNDGVADSAPATATAEVYSVVADAGGDQYVLSGQTAVLDGSRSSSVTSAPLSYEWSLYGKPEGSLAAPANAKSAQTTFKPDVYGTYNFSLQVSDGVDTRYDYLTLAVTHAYTQVASGNWFNCEIQAGDQALACWGYGSTGQTAPPAGAFGKLSVGLEHGCALQSSDGALRCWGKNDAGQASPPAGSFTDVSVGNRFSCAIKAADGSIACWGDNSSQQSTPPAGVFTQLSAGGAHACAIRSDGSLACWGSNDNGQTTTVSGTYSQVSAGYLHTCALSLGAVGGNNVQCWGNNGFNQTTAPIGNFSQINAGYWHNCGLRAGSVVCWGSNEAGEGVPPSGEFVQVDSGVAQSCALKSDGVMSCWGSVQGTPP